MYIASFHKYYIRARILNLADANLSIFNERLSNYCSDSSNFYQSIFNGTQKKSLVVLHILSRINKIKFRFLAENRIQFYFDRLDV